MRVSWIMAAGLAFALGCEATTSPAAAAKDDIPIDPEPTTTEGETGAPVPPSDPAAPPCDGKVTLRLRGSNVQANTRGELEIGAVEVRRDGQPIPTIFAARGRVTFPAPGAYRMAVLPLDVAAGPAEATFLVVDADWCSVGYRCYPNLVCGGSIMFRYEPSRVRPDNCHVVVELDVARSLHHSGGGAPFTPHYVVQY